jgi:peroxiredoxin Q/BCP
MGAPRTGFCYPAGPMIQIQKPAPAFSLPDQDGNVHSLADYRGKWVLLYFYPKDDTPGCTKESCGLRDVWSELIKRHCIVLGVSIDSPESHRKFRQKYELPFTLLSDESKEVVQAYGVWREKKFLGKAYMGTARLSFFIDPEGNVAKIYEDVKPEDHAQEVLQDLERLRTKAA